jgi:hypothetical protein
MSKLSFSQIFTDKFGFLSRQRQLKVRGWFKILMRRQKIGYKADSWINSDVSRIQHKTDELFTVWKNTFFRCVRDDRPIQLTEQMYI